VSVAFIEAVSSGSSLNLIFGFPHKQPCIAGSEGSPVWPCLRCWLQLGVSASCLRFLNWVATHGQRHSCEHSRHWRSGCATPRGKMHTQFLYL